MFYFFGEIAMIGLICGMMAAVYQQILSKEEVLHWWFRWGAQWEEKWFYKPIWGCPLCIAGQMALWSYIFMVATAPQTGQIPRFPEIATVCPFGLALLIFGNIFTICAAILSAQLFSFIINKTR